MTNAAKLASLGSPMIADTSGNVGIGTASPTAQLQLTKSGTGDYTTVRLSNSGASGRTYEIGLGGNTAAAGYANTLYFYDSNASAIRMAINSAGIVTTPFSPAFQAYMSGSTYMTSSQIMPLNNTRLNIGGCFNTSTYRFTAPVTGSYAFQTQFYVDSAGTWGNVIYKVNGTQYLYAETSAGSTQSLSPCIVISLNTNDYVEIFWATVTGKGVYRGASESSFSGFLIG